MALNPRKFLLKDLVNKPAPLDVWLQGTIEQTVGADILIIFDSTGRAKITKCESAHGIIDKTSLRKGDWSEKTKHWADWNALGETIAQQWDNIGFLFCLPLGSHLTTISTDGTYCCIIGTAIRTKGLPEVQASKFIDLTAEPHMKMAWEAEVKDADLFLEGKLIPTI